MPNQLNELEGFSFKFLVSGLIQDATLSFTVALNCHLRTLRKTSQTIKLTEAVANFVDARAFYVTCNQLFP